MLNALGRIMDMPNRPSQGNMQRLRPANPIVSDFMTQFSEQEEFMAYFREHWLKKIGKSLLNQAPFLGLNGVELFLLRSTCYDRFCFGWC